MPVHSQLGRVSCHGPCKLDASETGSHKGPVSAVAVRVGTSRQRSAVLSRLGDRIELLRVVRKTHPSVRV
ncbi:unnamed protein product [Heligmosomoides polygyrus]|uniref:Kinesin motor domain-containing protein n=1 Tax=Heligmosomoides polygyrus TaxID=6339 RepID=A0A183F9I5_HELPZ|nr:unnamed protein product [Heligmosomoides polygyrus]